MIKTPFTWDSANFAWNSNPFGTSQSTNPFIWDDVALIEGAAEALAGGKSQVNEYFKDEEKRKKFRKIICMVQGIEYKETREIIDRKITISEVKLVIKEATSTVKLIL